MGYFMIRIYLSKKVAKQIYIDDGVANNNQGGQRTVNGYFNLQYPGQDYNIDYETGEINFLFRCLLVIRLLAAYEYLGDGTGVVGSPKNVFVNGNDDTPTTGESQQKGYVTLKDKAIRGTESRRVYNLGNRNINPRDFQLTFGAKMQVRHSRQNKERSLMFKSLV